MTDHGIFRRIAVMEQSIVSRNKHAVAPGNLHGLSGVAVSDSESLIESLKTPKGGWTKASLALLGVPWPPPKGWKKRLIGHSTNGVNA